VRKDIRKEYIFFLKKIKKKREEISNSKTGRKIEFDFEILFVDFGIIQTDKILEIIFSVVNLIKKEWKEKTASLTRMLLVDSWIKNQGVYLRRIRLYGFLR